MKADHRIHVVSHGWHTGIILKADALNRHVDSLSGRFPKVDFYEIGWGDAGFYQAREITVPITLNAVFLPGDSVVHVVGFGGDPATYFPTSEVKSVALTGADLDRLCLFIGSSFAMDQSGKPVPSGAGLYGDSQFYHGVGKYHLLNGCNKWTAKALCSGGVEIEPALKITSASVMNAIGPHKEPSRSNGKRALKGR